MTTTQEKLTDRAELLALGVLYWRDCLKRKDLEWALEILGEEFARAKAAGEDLKELRTDLAERGVTVPEHVAASDSTEALEKPGLSQGERVCRMMKNADTLDSVPDPPYVRRANNQVSLETEALIRDLLTQGRTKTAIARALRVNRRVVIRVARETALSAD